MNKLASLHSSIHVETAEKRGLHEVEARIHVALRARKRHLERMQSFGPDDFHPCSAPPSPQHPFLSSNPQQHPNSGEATTSPHTLLTTTAEAETLSDSNIITENNNENCIDNKQEHLEMKPSLTNDSTLLEEHKQYIDDEKHVNTLELSNTVETHTAQMPLEKENVDPTESSQNGISQINGTQNLNRNIAADEDEFEIIENEGSHLITVDDNNLRNHIHDNKKTVSHENYLHTIDLVPKLQKLQQHFSSPIITDSILKESVKPVKAVKENQLNETINQSRRVPKTDVKTIKRTRHNSSIETIETSTPDEKSTTENVPAESKAPLSAVAANGYENLIDTRKLLLTGDASKDDIEMASGIAISLTDDDRTELDKTKSVLNKNHSPSNDNSGSQKYSQKDKKQELFKQTSIKRKSIDLTLSENTEDNNDTAAACSEPPNAKQVKKLQNLIPEKKKSPTKTPRRLSKDHSADKVRKYNQRIKQYNRRVEKENQGTNSTSVAPVGAGNFTTVNGQACSNGVTPFGMDLNEDLRESVDLNLNVSINQSNSGEQPISRDSLQQPSSFASIPQVSKMSTSVTENPRSKEINLDVDIEVTLENSVLVEPVNELDARYSSNRSKQPVQQQLSESSPVSEEIKKKQELEETILVNDMINDIAKRRAQRMVRSKATVPAATTADVKSVATSPFVTPQPSIDSESFDEPNKSNSKISLVKKLKKKVSNRFTRQSFDKSLDKSHSVDLPENNNERGSSSKHDDSRNFPKDSATTDTGNDLRIPSSRSQYDSGIEQTPCDLEISQDAIDYNNNDDDKNDSITPGLYVYSDDFPDVKLRDKKSHSRSKTAINRQNYGKSREVSFADSSVTRQESIDRSSDTHSKRKSGSHLHRYKRSSSKVKIARERSFDRDKHRASHHEKSLSREQSLDAGGGTMSRRGSLRRQKSQKDADEGHDSHHSTDTRNRSGSRDKSLSREDNLRNSLLKSKRKSFDRHKSMERQKSIDNRGSGGAPKPKFKSHKSKFLEELDIAKKKALIQMLRDNKLNLTKELNRKSIDLNEYEKIKKSLASVIKGPVRQDSKDEFNAFNIRNKFNKEIEKNQKVVSSQSKQLRNSETTARQTDNEKLKTVKENAPRKPVEIDAADGINKTKSIENSTVSKANTLKSPEKIKSTPTTVTPEIKKLPQTQQSTTTPKIVFELDDVDENSYFNKRKQRRIRKNNGQEDDEEDEEEITKEKVSISQQIDLMNLKRAKEKNKPETKPLPGSTGNRNLEYKGNENTKTEVSKTAIKIKAEEPKVNKGLTKTQEKLSPVKKKDVPRSKSAEPFNSSTKDRAAIFGPRKVFKQVKSPIAETGNNKKLDEDEKEKTSIGGFNAIANLRSSLRRVAKKPSQEEQSEQALPMGTFLLPDPEAVQQRKKVNGSGGLAALLERDANSRDSLKFEDKPKKPGHEEKEDVRGISANSLQKGKYPTPNSTVIKVLLTV